MSRVDIEQNPACHSESYHSRLNSGSGLWSPRMCHPGMYSPCRDSVLMGTGRRPTLVLISSYGFDMREQGGRLDLLVTLDLIDLLVPLSSKLMRCVARSPGGIS